MRCEMPWSASSGATMSARTSASPMAAAAIHASPWRLRSEERVRSLLRDDVLEGRPREYSEDRVVQDEKQQEALAVGRDRSTDTTHDQRDRQREEEKRKEQFSRASGGRHRRQERPDGTDPDVGEQHTGDRGGIEGLEEQDECRQRDGLRGEEEDE